MGLADTISRMTGFISTAGILLLIVGLPYWLIAGGGAVVMIGLVLAVTPATVGLLQLALSRAREFDADLDAAKLTGDPGGLASALEKLEASNGGWLERLVFGRARHPDPSLLRTHPTTDQRVRRLLSLFPQGKGEAFRAPVSVRLPRSFTAVMASPRRRISGLWY
jgi:heat shock protein HtpX